MLGALRQAGHDVDRLDPVALATLEDFRLGGRATTAHLADLADIHPGTHVLDMGCGIGGPARFLAQQGCHVTSVDLTPEFVSLAGNSTLAVGSPTGSTSARPTPPPFPSPTPASMWPGPSTSS